MMIFGLFGCSEMGIADAAIITVIKQWSVAIIEFILNYAQNKEIHFIFKGCCLHKEGVYAIDHVSVPTILTQTFGNIMVIAMKSI